MNRLGGREAHAAFENGDDAFVYVVAALVCAEDLDGSGDGCERREERRVSSADEARSKVKTHHEDSV